MFDTGKTRMIGLPYGEKKVTICLSRFHLIPERHGRTDGRTDRRTELLYYQYQCADARSKCTVFLRHGVYSFFLGVLRVLMSQKS